MTAYQVFDHIILLKICGHVQKNKWTLTTVSLFFLAGGGGWGWEGVGMVLNSEVKRNISIKFFFWKAKLAG